jgi:hypothetical protein
MHSYLYHLGMLHGDRQGGRMPPTDDDTHRDHALRYLAQSLGALLRGASDDANALLDLADDELAKLGSANHETAPDVSRPPDEG